MDKVNKICDEICDNMYRICYKDYRCVNHEDGEQWIIGYIRNFNEKTLTVYAGEGRLYVIPYNKVVWMLPVGLTRQENEIISEKFIKQGIKTMREVIKSYENLVDQADCAKKMIKMMDDFKNKKC